MNFSAKLEPDGRILTGAGQVETSDVLDYSRALQNEANPVIFMDYVDAHTQDVRGFFRDLRTKLTALSWYSVPQIGLGFDDDQGKPYEGRVAAGEFDDNLRILCSELASFDRPVYLRIGYEFHGSWNGYTATSYKEAFRRVHRMLQAAGAQNVATVWCAEAGSLPADYDKFYPGDDVVDWWGIDFFGKDDFTGNSNVAHFMAGAQEHRRPVMIGESTPKGVGAGNGIQSWDYWFASYFRFIDEHPQVKAFCYINWDWAVYAKRWSLEWADWGDCRLIKDSYVADRFLNEVKSPVYLKGSSSGREYLESVRLNSIAKPKALSELSPSLNGRFLVTAGQKPFFWLGDTAWELIHATTRDECSYYLSTRARQGFTVVQTNLLSEFDGLNTPNLQGERPFFDNDPLRPNERFFDRVVEIVDEAAARGLYVAVVPAWGDKMTAPWGAGPRVFTLANLETAKSYGRYLGERLRIRTNVIYLLGGDRPADLKNLVAGEFPLPIAESSGFSAGYDWSPIWSAIAGGLADGLGRPPLCVYHPQAGPNSSSQFLGTAGWLSVNGIQSGHGGGHDIPVWDWIARDAAILPARPTLDLEPNYEDCPYNPWPRWDPSTGYFRDYDVRKQTYRSVFAGGCGVTYGHHAVWQFANERKEGLLYVDRDWIDALNRPGGREMIHLRSLMESRPFLNRIRDNELIVSGNGQGPQHLEATRDIDGTYAFVYFPESDHEISIDLRRLKAKTFQAWWYDPRNGFSHSAGRVEGDRVQVFRSPSYGPDWVLVLDDVRCGYYSPGSSPFEE